MNTSLQPDISNTSIPIQNDWLLLLVANLPGAILVEDEKRVIQFANKAFCEVFNLNVAPELLQGTPSKDVWNKFTGNDSEALKTINSIAQQSNKITGKEIELQSGRILVTDFVSIQQNEKIAGYLWQFKEETEKINADRSLREQRKFYEDVLNSIPSDIAVFSPDHKYLYINPVGLGDPDIRQWLIGKDDFDYCAKRNKDISFAQNRRDVFNKIIETGKQKEWEEKIINKKGETEYHLRKLSPIYDSNNNLVWIIGYSVNITERKKIEEKIQLSEKRYRDLFDYSQAIICTHDMSGNFLTANPSLLEVMGYSLDEIVGKSIKDFLQEQDKLAFDDIYLNAIKENNKVKGVFKVVHKNGSKIYLLYQNYRVEESPDSEAYIIAFAQDVTERVKAEKELKVAKQITEETARNKERFLANMSHEIRTPMNGIIGITSFLQKTTLNDEQKSYLNIVQESAHDLLTIINDILDLEKVGTGQIQLENIPFDIISKTNTIIKLFEITAKNKGVDIRFENKVGNELTISGDPTRFNQVLNNLISNAVKFTSKGHITIRVEKQRETSNEVTLQFSVSDTGIGIDPNNLEKIFNPFTQAYPETTRMYGGTGLGLAITKNLVELQGGTIIVDSQPKKGSTFTFTITYKKTESESALSIAKEPLTNTLGELNILVAEDNEINQVLTTGMLQQLGFKASFVSNGVDVLNLLQKEDFDLILMDIQMPEMNGYEATREIRTLSDTKRNIPIIALTANALKGEEENYIAAGMNGYLTKPFSEAALYETIKAVLETRQDTIQQNEKEMSQPSNAVEKLYDLTMVNELARGNQEFILNLAKIFIDTVPPTAKEMTEACEQKKWEQMGKLAHKLKSTIDTLNIASLKDDIRAIEKNGKEQKNLDITPVMVEKADMVIRQVSEQLKAEFNL